MNKTTKTITTKQPRHIYCDGSAPNNHKGCTQGGYGVAVYDYQYNLIGKCGKTVRETTNCQRTALMAVIYALMYAESGDIIYTDLDGICNGYNSGLDTWKASGWLNANKKPIKNRDLWEQVDELKAYNENVSVAHVFARSGNRGNEVAESLAREAAKGDEVEEFDIPTTVKHKTPPQLRSSSTPLVEPVDTATSIIYIDTQKLQLNQLYTTRSAEEIADHNELKARKIERERLGKDLYDILARGGEYDQPIITAIVNSVRVVIDGHLRTQVAQKYANKHHTEIQVKARCLGVMSQVEAFKAAQKMNMEHGLHISAEAKRHILFREHILMNMPIDSTRKIADMYGLSSPSSGAAIQQCLKWIQPYQGKIQTLMAGDNAQGALEYVQSVIQEELIMSEKAFDTLGIPTAKKWAQAIKMVGEDFSNKDDDEQELQKWKAEVSRYCHAGLSKYGADMFRYFLNSEPKLKSSMGITVKRSYDEEAVASYIRPDEF